MNICWRCKNEVTVEGELDPKRRCPRCAAIMRCCRNCASFVTKADPPCKESRAPVIEERDKVNECTFFRFKSVRVVDFSDQVSAKRKVRQALGGRRRPPTRRSRPNDSFGGRGPNNMGGPDDGAPRNAEEAKRRLEELFNK